jgi:hypothetical protein
MNPRRTYTPAYIRGIWRAPPYASNQRGDAARAGRLGG